MTFTAAITKLLTLRCREAAELSSASVDERLGAVDRWALRLHLLICGRCRRFKRQIRLLRQLVAELLKHMEEDRPEGLGLSEEARARLRALLTERRG